jgi:hypothetical protein
MRRFAAARGSSARPLANYPVELGAFVSQTLTRMPMQHDLVNQAWN